MPAHKILLRNTMSVMKNNNMRSKLISIFLAARTLQQKETLTIFIAVCEV